MLVSIETFRKERELSRSRAYEIAKGFLMPAGAVVRYGRSIRIDVEKVRALEAAGGFPTSPRRRRRAAVPSPGAA